jgi:ubiquinone/menaquinone biosynthesis C-methylase UbiE
MKSPSPNKLMSLPANPSGWMGRVFGKLMELTNADVYQKTIQALAPSDNERFLEIGFGTGRCAEMLLLTTTDTFVAGVDPTETMVKTTRSRLIKKGFGDRIDIRQGTDDSLPWGDGQFDAVVAIHSFQFWPDPHKSIIEISRILRPQGRIVIAFRDHANSAPNWLPNPISRSGREIDETASLLEKHGYKTTKRIAAGSSRIIRAVGGASSKKLHPQVSQGLDRNPSV